ncbi:MAG: hypothetical protein Q9162_002751 [Coniocarpon cinnabarinum]
MGKVSLQPFEHPVCTADGVIFDLTNILPWLKKHGTSPVDGSPLKSSELVKLNFAKNEDGEYVDPVTYKPFTDNTHIVALRNTGNVFAHDTVDRLNIKAKNWKDLITNDTFARADITTLQDPQNLASRDLSKFKYIQDGESTHTPQQESERSDPSNNINAAAMGSSARVIKAKEAVARARADRAAAKDKAMTGSGEARADREGASALRNESSTTGISRAVPINAASYTTGKAAASLTSTGVSLHTGNERALLSDEDFMLKPKRVKSKGYARVQTSHGDVNLELYPEHAPRAVWNFTRLANKGYYKGVKFHRNIRNFMIQGGDPSGTGKGGQSIWGKPFVDEYAQSPLSHNTRGILSMANKGKDTNTSQFFITYRKTPHLDRKHTIFGKCINNDPGGETDETLKKLENVESDESNRPIEECVIEDVIVFVDPFEEFIKSRSGNGALNHLNDRNNDDETTTWSGKRVHQHSQKQTPGATALVGKYLASKSSELADEAESGDLNDHGGDEPAVKKRKVEGGFGNFDEW